MVMGEVTSLNLGGTPQCDVPILPNVFDVLFKICSTATTRCNRAMRISDGH